MTPCSRIWASSPRPSVPRFRTDDGGLFNTARDVEALIAQLRDASDNASPSASR
jgi:hypothetical protein